MKIDPKFKKDVKKQADYIANHYGFDLLNIKETVFRGKEKEIAEEEKIKVLKTYTKKEIEGKKQIPTKMFFYNKPVLKTAKKQKNKIGLDILNLESSSAEATIIKTAFSILQTEGYKDLKLEINSIGDKESVKNFKKELSAYYKTKSSEIKAPEKNRFKKDPFSLYCGEQKEYINKINEDSPNPIAFLSEKSLKHFTEVIEFLEALKIPYTINNSLMGDRNYFSKIIFQITGKEEGKNKKEEILAFGGRYDEIASEITRKRKISAVGITMDFTMKNKKNVKLQEKDVNIHLIKVGSQAKLKYLDILEIFKKVSHPIDYKIEEKKISEQLRNAVDSKSDYTLILGQKEATEDHVVLRNMQTKSQEKVPIKNLEKYIKKLI